MKIQIFSSASETFCIDFEPVEHISTGLYSSKNEVHVVPKNEATFGTEYSDEIFIFDVRFFSNALKDFISPMVIFKVCTICHVITPSPSRVRRPLIQSTLFKFYFLHKLYINFFFAGFAGPPYLGGLIHPGVRVVVGGPVVYGIENPLGIPRGSSLIQRSRTGSVPQWFGSVPYRT